MSGQLLLDCQCTAPIPLPPEAIDLPEWLFNFSDSDYQRCSTQHFAAGTSRAADGKRMSINVEQIGETLLFGRAFPVRHRRCGCRTATG